MLDFLVFTSMILLALFILIISIANGFYIGVVLSLLMMFMASQIY
ncbi:MAG: hypothetical protein ACI3T9_04040 [Romboutsia timonensis]